jgi:3-hydroxyisobutyrate dehydrogenase
MMIGICGTGRMGSAMTERLIEQGHSVKVWNRTPARAEALTKLGAGVAGSPAALAAECEAVICMLFDEAAQQAVYKGDNGLLAGVPAGRLIIDMSTVMPDAAKALAADVASAGATFVECPVGGTVAPAKAGKLLGMAGGDADAVARARPILEQLCRRVEHVGPAGAGAAMKLAINLPLGVYWEALGEALSFSRAAGIDPELAGSLLADSSGAISVAGPRIPTVVDALGGRPDAPGAFDIAGMAKDLGLMRRFAEQNGFAAPVAEAAGAAYEEAASDGWASNDAPLLAAWRTRRNTGS